MLNKIIPIIGVLAIAPFISAQDEKTVPAPQTVPATETVPAQKTPELTAEKKQLFLQGLGWIMAKQSGISALELSPKEAEEVAKGFLLSLQNKGEEFIEKITPIQDEYSAFIQEKQEAAQKKAEAQLAAEAQANKDAGKAYIEKCKQDKSFRVLESGVLMKVEKAGDDKNKPTPQSFISVRYTGSTIDGKIFDSSMRDEQGVPQQFSGKSEPAAFPFPLEGLIPGWIEALQQVGQGAKIRLVIPAEQAYGDRGAGNGLIKPGSTLIFDLELVSVSDKSPEPEAPEMNAGE